LGYTYDIEVSPAPYQQFSLQTGTALHETDETFAFTVVALDRDVFAITGSLLLVDI
jgi:hypothetical protein